MKRCPLRIASSESPARSGQRFSRPNGKRTAPRAAARPRAPTSEWVMPRWVSSAHTPRLQKMSTSGSSAPPTIARVACRPQRWRKPACAIAPPINPCVSGSTYGPDPVPPGGRRPGSARAIAGVTRASDVADELLEGGGHPLEPPVDVEGLEQLLTERGGGNHRRGDLVRDGAGRLPVAQHLVQELPRPAEGDQQPAAEDPDPLDARAGVPRRRHLVEPPERDEPVERIRRDLALDARPGRAAEENVVAPGRQALPPHDLAHPGHRVHGGAARVGRLVAGLEADQRQLLVP